MTTFDLGLIDGQTWSAASVDAIEAQINKIYQFDTFANRPASGAAQGSLFFDTTNSRLWQWIGSAWVLLSGNCGVHVRRQTTTQSFPNGAITDVSYDFEYVDTDGFIATPGTTITIPAGLGGVYGITYAVYGCSIASSNSLFYARLNVSSSFILPNGITSSNGTDGPPTSLVMPLVAGDTVKVQVSNNTGSAVTANVLIYLNRLGR